MTKTLPEHFSPFRPVGWKGPEVAFDDQDVVKTLINEPGGSLDSAGGGLLASEMLAKQCL